jgi:hypothetical protein
MEVCTRFKVLVVKLQIQMMSLKIGKYPNRGYCTGKFTRIVQDIFGLKGNTLLEFVTVDPGFRLTVILSFQGTGVPGWKGAP